MLSFSEFPPILYFPSPSVSSDLMFVVQIPHKAVCTSNHMFGRAIWDKLPECIFENFENDLVKREQFQNFKKKRGWFIPKIAWTKYVVTG